SGSASATHGASAATSPSVGSAASAAVWPWRGLKETVKTMGRLVLADSREIQELAAVVFKKFEAEKGGLSEQQEATGKAYDAQSTALREKAKNGEQVDYESRGAPHAAIFAASVKWWGTQGNLTKQELTDGFASLWKDVIMRFTSQQVAALAQYFRWKPHRGKPNKGKGKSNSDDMQEDAKGTDKGMIMYAVELSHANGPKLSMLLAEAMADMRAIHKPGAAPPGPLHRQLSRMINEI
ncbi:unnamed protein product, partial [Prorocentrum cordatum]